MHITLFFLLCIALSGAHTDHNSTGLIFNLEVKNSDVVNGRVVRRYLSAESPDAPLYRGFGTHFVYIWVGTPPQRVSVIVDTGSHHTAFPCKGCSNCGKHTNQYFDPGLSKSAVISRCGSQKCLFSQSYTEGSSWKAYKIKDTVWIGGEKVDMLDNDNLPNWNVTFTFGCQSSETGLFRTQLENGIMGMSADPNTLPYALVAHKIIKTNVFSLCFLHTGGTMAIGATNAKLNKHEMQYAAMLKKSGYFTVFVEGVFLRKPGDEKLQGIGESKTKYNTGKGIIVDSGTTDSYLPSSIASSFMRLFRSISGITYSNSAMSLTSDQIKRLPVIVYRLRSSESFDKFIEVEFPPKNYVEPVPGQHGRYVIRLYLHERSGGVIGANMMIGHNVVFDQHNMRVGFAKSDCLVQNSGMHAGVTKPSKIHRRLQLPVRPPKGNNNPSTRTIVQNTIDKYGACARPSGPCNAICARGPKSTTAKVTYPGTGFYAHGFQVYTINQSCLLSQNIKAVTNNQQLKACRIPCTATSKPHITGDPLCPTTVWGDCRSDCTQERIVGRALHVTNNCTKHVEKRSCRSKLCTFDHFKECTYVASVTIPSFDLRIWSKVWKEEMISAMAKVLKVDPGVVDIPFHPQRTMDMSVQIIFHIRLYVNKSQPSEKSRATPTTLCQSIPMLDQVSRGNTVEIVNEFLANLYSLESPACGDWKWLKGDIITIQTHTPLTSSVNKLESQLAMSARHRKRSPSKVGLNKSKSLAVNMWSSDSFIAMVVVAGILVTTLILFAVYSSRQNEMRRRIEAPRRQISVPVLQARRR